MPVKQMKILLAVWMVMCGMAAVQCAHAEPPSEKAPVLHTATAAVASLDLRPPSLLQARGSSPSSMPGADAEFSAANRRTFAGAPPGAPPATAQSGRIMSPFERLAHNFHDEGLPVAKLFQNEDSLVHLGLNPKGKPGLWLIHKLH